MIVTGISKKGGGRSSGAGMQLKLAVSMNFGILALQLLQLAVCVNLCVVLFPGLEIKSAFELPKFFQLRLGFVILIAILVTLILVFRFDKSRLVAIIFILKLLYQWLS